MKLPVLFKWIFLPLIVFISYTEGYAQMQRNDWIGTYAMNHDGWEGTLVIRDTKKDCSITPWCSLDIYYINSAGEKRKAAIANFSKDWQKIAFDIQFPEHVQRFEGYKFSHDKSMLAGTTEWNRKNFGFYAKKKPEQVLSQVNLRDLKVIRTAVDYKEFKKLTPTQDEVVKRVVRDDGTVELTYESGKTEHYHDGTITVKFPDGTEQTLMMMQVMTLAPPMPNEPDVNSWLTMLNSNIDDIVSHLLNGDETSINNYKKALSKYKDVERINNSMKTIGFLIE